MSRRNTIRIAVLAGVLVAAVLGARAAFGSEGAEFKAKFEATVGLYAGSEVQMLGVPVGKVTAVEPSGDSVTVTMKLDKGQDAAADTKAVIIAPTLVSDRFVQLTEPYVDGPKLKNGTVLSTASTAIPVEIDDLYGSLIDVSERLGPNGANKNGALSELLEVAAKNLDGQGQDINQLVTEFGKATGTLADTGDDLFATLGNFKEFNDMLVANDRDVANVNRQFAAVTDYLAEDRADLADAVANLGDALGIVDDFIEDNRGNLQTSVENLLGPTQVLVKQKDSLEEGVRTIPLVLQNFLKAYDPKTGTLAGRGNLNEITLWAGDGLSASTSKKAPPVLLPGVGGNE